MTTGQLIKDARKRAGLTQKELGEKLGITYQTIAQWENDLRKPKIETLNRIATALSVDPYSIMDFDMASNAIEDRATAQERIAVALALLNDMGMEKAAEAVEIIAEVARYRRQDRPQAAPAPQEGQSTTPAPDGPTAAPEGE